MDRPYCYEIRIEGHLSERWSEWFEGLEILNYPEGEATISGQVSDQAALLSILNKIHDLNLTLVAVRRLPAGN